MAWLFLGMEEKIHCRDEGEHKKGWRQRHLEHPEWAWPDWAKPCEEGGEERVKRSYWQTGGRLGQESKRGKKGLAKMAGLYKEKQRGGGRNPAPGLESSG